MNVNELGNYIREHKEQLIESLLDGSYKPQRALAVEIPKASGEGVRQIAIPVAIDRLVQQAIAQVLEPILDSTFSESSYGFRPNRNAHQALRQAQIYVQDGRDVVVDLDVEKFFDRVNRDVLMARLAKRVKDKRVLRIVRKFLEAGMIAGGLYRAANRNNPRVKSCATIIEPAARRARQGARKTRAQILSLCR